MIHYLKINEETLNVKGIEVALQEAYELRDKEKQNDINNFNQMKNEILLDIQNDIQECLNKLSKCRKLESIEYWTNELEKNKEKYTKTLNRNYKK